MCTGGMLITQSFNLSGKRRIEGRGEKGEAGWIGRKRRKEEKGEARWMGRMSRKEEKGETG